MNHRLRAWMLAGLAGSVLAGLTWWWTREAPSPATAAHPGASSAPDAAPGDASRAHAPLPTGRFDDLRPDLEAAARAGHPEAAFIIGRTIAHCLHHQPMPGGRFTTMLAELIASAGDTISIGGRPLGDDRNLDMLLFAQEESQRLCAGTDGLRAAPPDDSAFDWIARAADAGHTGAMALYPHLAFDAYRDDAALLADMAEVVRRRERARAHLHTALERGEPAALGAAAQAYGADGVFGPDPARSLAYFLAYRQTREGARAPHSLLDTAEHRYARGLDAVARRNAEAAAQQILAGWPRPETLR